ncbi:helix-turn-helix domain-containing protein [Bacteroides caecigallinarum]|uniref:helix-turn-helix domain-containing protein n=1 Tax=Bacteroides caecigallinarum TaxID=1411144 RepID=UPI001F3B1653|nr:helix-turn-helix domain-containing protein [Bacteroides caecigallinarum]
MKQRKINCEGGSVIRHLKQMENLVSKMTSEKPIERIQSLEQRIGEIDKIPSIENYVQQIKERIWVTKEVLTTSEASAYLGLSESYIYKLTASRQIPHYKPNGKLVFFNRKELCEWALRNQVEPNKETTIKSGTI